ncbi:single-stranded-DNA-specific exonuclease RecJ [Paenibacillus ginsengarvi]|uniref:Single-stranded-DNA-specific exonuclease RecJ n=1 Tax=Paenibacillus ginsengarvi TaxID=400777 RepID=A0A3B0CCG8_9BACL|nr:single-stranded-DNA-specific exonuclease RecJ [Paenibacillus ginsengarvi]RKN83812.1 single-stranded-DNA-specific exonuclease RecJ [Paenibacillus ginsengarvi]
MLHSKAKWNIGTVDSAIADRLCEELGLHPVVGGLLVTRGITDIGEAERFLKGEKDHFHDPFLLDGMEEAVRRIRQALQANEKIRVYGDYDADGVSSTALMTHLLRRLGADFDTYIPHRALEGYGLNAKAIELAKESGVTLLITVDTGISAVEQVALAKELGIDVVVTDHHEPPEWLPDAVAVLNPKKPGCPYPFKQLAGVGVAFKLAHALLGEPPLDLLEIAAIGTVADLMPLLGENRSIVKLGLDRMQKSSYIGIKALLDVSGVTGKEVTATHLGFSLAPRINASGRLDHAEDAVMLLTTDNKEEAEHIAASLDELNKERQRIVEEMTGQALEKRAIQDPDARDQVIVVAEEGWNVGVIGIVAAKLLERYYRPVIVLGIDPETGLAKGSARSIPGFDLYRALTQCAGLLDHYGGHQAAAGMTLHRDRLDEFRQAMNAAADEWLTEDDLVPVQNVDAEFALEDVTVEFIRQLEMLAPFGMANPSPRFVLSGLRVQEKRALGKDRQHLKLMLAKPEAAEGGTVEAIGFGRGAYLDLISATAKVDILGEFGINEWNGVRKPQILIHDMQIPQTQVFDWRGAKQAVQKLEEVTEELRRISDRNGGYSAIVVDADSPTRQIDPDRLPCGLWAMDVRRGAIPLNAVAKQAVFEEASDVLLLSMPGQLASLEKLLERCEASRIYAAFADWDRDYASVPSRDIFKALYQAVIRQNNWAIGNAAFLEPVRRKLGLSEGLIRFMLNVFEELEFIVRQGETYTAVSSPRKRDMNESEAYQSRLKRSEVEQMLVYSNAQQLAEWISDKLEARATRTMEGIV